MRGTAAPPIPWFHEPWRPKPLSVIAFAVALLIVMPLGYVLGNAFLVTGEVWLQLWRSRVPELLYNTLRLTAGVAVVTVVLGVGLAWLVVRYDFFGRSVWTWLLAAPLGIPPYIMAYGYTELFAYWGPLRPLIQRFLGPDVHLPALYNSLPAAVVVLSLATYPYVYLLSRAAFLRTNLAFEEAARLSGAGRLRSWLRVVLPMQRPAIAAGLFLVCLYVMADFGAVSILRYSTFTRAVYVQMAGRYDLMGAAALSLILVVLSFAFFAAERHFRRRSRFYQTTAGYRPGGRATLLGWRSVLAFCCCVAVFTIGFGVPVLYLAAEAWTSIGQGALDGAFWGYARNSVLGSAAAATVAVAAALPLAYVALRRPGRLHSLFLHASYAGYVLPGPIIALGLIFCTAHLMAPVYGTVAVVVLAYVVRFFPQCLQAGEAALHQITPALEEAGRSNGVPLWRVLYRVTLPLMRPGLVTGWVLVFVNAMKELPATLLLRPVGFDTLAVRIWIETSEEFYAQAAPAALLLILITLPLLAFALGYGSTQRSTA